MINDEFHDEAGRLIDPRTGEVGEGEPTFRAKLKGTSAVKTDKDGDVEFDVTFTLSGPRDALPELMDPITALMAENAAGDVVEVRVKRAAKAQGRLW